MGVKILQLLEASIAECHRRALELDKIHPKSIELIDTLYRYDRLAVELKDAFKKFREG